MINTTTEFVAIDLEATGLDYKSDTIIEIALAHFVDGEITRTFNKCINPNRLITPFIHNLTGIHQNEIDAATPFAAEAQEIRNFIGTLPVVAHNSYFDTTMLNACFERVSVPALTENHVFDSLLAARIAWPHFPNHRLGTVIQELNIEVPASHRALPDAIAAGKVFLQAQQVFSEYSTTVLTRMSVICSTLHKAENQSWATLFNTPGDIGDITENVAEPLVDYTHSHSDLTLDRMVSQAPRLDITDPLNQKVVATLQHPEALIAQNGSSATNAECYLPAVLQHCAQTDDRIVISTNKKSRALLHATIESFQTQFDITIPYTILQSRDQYLCLQKFSTCLRNADVLLTEAEKLTFLTLIPWAYTTNTGDITRHKGFNLSRNRQLWYKLSGTGSSCNGSICTDTYNCFAHRARKRAESAQLVVVDHHSFFKDMQLDFSFIPPYDGIIFDESSDLYQVGYNYLCKSIWYFKLKNIIQTFSNQTEADTGLYGLLTKVVSDSQALEIVAQLRIDVKECEKSLHRFFMKFGKNAHKRNHEKRSKLPYQQPIALEFNTSPDKLLKAFTQCLETIQALQTALDTLSKTPLAAKELNEFSTVISDFHRELAFLCAADNDQFSFWSEDFNNPHKIRVQSAPVDPYQVLPLKFYENTRSVIFISRTQTVLGKTSYVRKLFSLEASGKTIKQFMLNAEKPLYADTPVLISKETHKQPSKEKMQNIITTLQKVSQLQHEKIIILFQNPYFLKQAHKVMLNDSKTNDYKVYSQDIDSNIENLGPLFCSAEKSILLMTATSVDLTQMPPEHSLLIIYTQLPFPDTQHPGQRGVCDFLDAQGGNAFADYLVPQTSLVLQQSMYSFLHLPNPKQYLFLDSRAGAEKFSPVFTAIWNNTQQTCITTEAVLTAIGTRAS